MSVASRREQPQAATYSKRLKDSIKSILDNYGEILKASKVNISLIRTSEAITVMSVVLNAVGE